MNRFGLLAAWIVATGIATLLAWQVVGAADDQISDAPDTPVIAVTTPDVSTTSVPTDSSSSTTVTSSASTSSSTVDPGSTTSTTTNTSTTAPDSSTSTTTSGIPATTTAVSDGGTVTVTGVEPNVELVAVVAVPGWSYEVDSAQGDRVQVTFANGTGEEIRVRCEWENGQLVADIDDD